METSTSGFSQTWTSPAGTARITFTLKAGIMLYVPTANCPFIRVTYKDKVLLPDVQLGLLLGGAADLGCCLGVEAVEEREHDESWRPLYGERDLVRDRYREVRLTLREQVMPGRALVLEFRLYDEGLAFRYAVPRQDGVEQVEIVGEATDLHFADGTEAWSVYRIEGEYTRVPIREVREKCMWPFTFACPNGLYGCLTEAGRYAYPTAWLSPRWFQQGDFVLRTDLMGTAHGPTPFTTGWRLLIAGERPGDLLEHNFLVDNLNPPCAIEDTSWIRPGKAIRADLTTAEGKACVDFAVARGMQHILLDWGWYGMPEQDASDARFVDIIEPMSGKRPEKRDLDIPELAAYGASKGIGLFLYVNRHALERQAPVLFPLYRSWGVAGVKPGFVRWGSQGWSQWTTDLVKLAAENRLMLDIHDEFRPTGLCRTYPNLLTVEGIRGNENNPTAAHNCTLPFARYPAGPGDYTPCYYILERAEQFKNTFTHQLALPIVFYSPLMLLYWYSHPKDYRGEPEIELWDRMPTVWNETRCLAGAIGETVTIARRTGRDWYVGSLTNEEARVLNTPLDFLEPGTRYAALICADDPGASTRTRVAVARRTVTSADTLEARLAPSGGHAVWLTPE